MGNHRHVPDVILLVHDPADLLHSELHLQDVSERVRTRQNEEVQRCDQSVTLPQPKESRLEEVGDRRRPGQACRTAKADLPSWQLVETLSAETF